MEQTKKSLNVGTILLLVIALLYIPTIISVFQGLFAGVFGIKSIIRIAIFVITILFGISLSSKNNFAVTKIYPLVLCVLYAVIFIQSVISMISVFNEFNLFGNIAHLVNALCYLMIFLFYKNSNGEDTGRIKNLLPFSIVGIICVIASVVLIFASGATIGYGATRRIIDALLLALPFVVLCVFSGDNIRVPLSQGRTALKKAGNKIVAAIVVIGILIGLLALFGVFDTRTEAEKWEDGAKGALEEYMEYKGMIRD